MTATQDGAQYESLGWIKANMNLNANVVCRLVACKAIRVKAHPASYPKYCVDDIRAYLEEQGRGTTPRKSSPKAAIPIEPSNRKAAASTK
jgi:hypothetical protein